MYGDHPDDSPAPAIVTDESRCVGCGYELRGLPADGRCPECAVDISRSLEGNLLVLSAAGYLASLHRGVLLILVAIVLQCAGALGGLASGIVMALTGIASKPAFVVLFQFGALALEAMIVYGWWLFSAPDPAIAGTDTGDQARRILRVALIVGAGASLFTAATQVVQGVSAADRALAILVGSVGIVEFVAMVVRFFAAMLYLRWLAQRLPNVRVYERAGTLMWLGPVLMTVGALILVGPLIALVLYWIMLDWVRRDLKRIRFENAARFGNA